MRRLLACVAMKASSAAHYERGVAPLALLVGCVLALVLLAGTGYLCIKGSSDSAAGAGAAGGQNVSTAKWDDQANEAALMEGAKLTAANTSSTAEAASSMLEHHTDTSVGDKTQVNPTPDPSNSATCASSQPQPPCTPVAMFQYARHVFPVLLLLAQACLIPLYLAVLAAI
jgi:hypothetical protein